MLQRALLEAADRGAVNFVLAFPNARSEPIIRRVGYQRIAPLITLVRAVRTSHYLAAAGLPQGMARCLGGVADFLINRVPRSGPAALNRRLEGSLINSFDRRFDVWCDSNRDNFAATGERSSAYLRWRFTQTPNGTGRIFATVDRTTAEVIGYVVYWLKAGLAEIRDLGLPRSTALSKDLLSRFLEHTKCGGAHGAVIGVMENAHTLSALRSVGFVSRGSEGGVYCYLSAGRESELQLPAEPADWFILQGDDDV
jgi:hypothetical protein